MEDNNRNIGPGGIVWSHDDVATHAEIVECFEALSSREITDHNWGTCIRPCQDQWKVTKETYINGIMMTLDFDYRMGYLIQAVDRTSRQCTYIAIVLYHGRRTDGTFEKDWMVWPGTHTFFGREEGFDEADICRWAVGVIYGAIDAHDEAMRSSPDV